MITQAGSLRSSLHTLENLLEGYSPPMSGMVEKVVDNGIKFGSLFAEVGSPVW
jgi:hypothetical protein